MSELEHCRLSHRQGRERLRRQRNAPCGRPARPGVGAVRLAHACVAAGHRRSSIGREVIRARRRMPPSSGGCSAAAVMPCSPASSPPQRAGSHRPRWTLARGGDVLKGAPGRGRADVARRARPGTPAPGCRACSALRFPSVGHWCCRPSSRGAASRCTAPSAGSRSPPSSLGVIGRRIPAIRALERPAAMARPRRLRIDRRACSATAAPTLRAGAGRASAAPRALRRRCSLLAVASRQTEQRPRCPRCSWQAEGAAAGADAARGAWFVTAARGGGPSRSEPGRPVVGCRALPAPGLRRR